MSRSKTNNHPTVRSRFTDLFDFDNFLNEPFFDSSLVKKWGNRIPATNIVETDDSYSVHVAAPGLKKKDFEVNVEEGVLEIKVEKETEDKEEEENYTRREYSYTNFCRTFSLPENVDSSKVKARYEDGELKIEIPKLPETEKKQKQQVEVA